MKEIVEKVWIPVWLHTVAFTLSVQTEKERVRERNEDA